MNIFLKISNVGNSVEGPFSIYSDTDNFINAFADDVSLDDLLLGFVADNVPDNTNVVRVFNKTGVCLNSVDTVIGNTIEP